MGGVLKRRGDRGGTWGGWCLFTWSGELTKKKTTMKIRRGLRWPPTNGNLTTTNVKHTGAMKEVKEGSCNW
jgi:hypothetical protein